jgi:hypothetical protein
MAVGYLVEADDTVENAARVCDEFLGIQGSPLVIPVACDPTMSSARAGVLEADRREMR